MKRYNWMYDLQERETQGGRLAPGDGPAPGYKALRSNGDGDATHNGSTGRVNGRYVWAPIIQEPWWYRASDAFGYGLQDRYEDLEGP